MTESYDRAMNQAMTYLGARARSAKQMADYLEKKGHDERTIAQVMEKLTEYRFIDDESYARRFVEAHAGADGAYLLRRKMVQRGLMGEAIDRALEEVPFSAQVEAARTLIEKKLRGDDRPDALRRAVQAAMRRGFPYDAVREAAQNLQEDVEWEE